MRIDVLYFDGCPHHGPTIALIDEVARELGIRPTVIPIEVGEEDVSRHRFLGSPTVRVDGRDIEPGAQGRTDYAMSCRLYEDLGVPSRLLIEAALQAAP